MADATVDHLDHYPAEEYVADRFRRDQARVNSSTQKIASVSS
jgi:hypothetical protein